jgi:hypothetical protein
MAKTRNLQGKFRISSDARLRARMGRLRDARRGFYEAMLKAETYERYLLLAGPERVFPIGRNDGPFSAAQEFRYALKRRWIAV